MSISSVLGLLRQSGRVVGGQQAPAGNHRDGHPGGAGRKNHPDLPSEQLLLLDSNYSLQFPALLRDE